jgi:DNA repair protein RecO (recombination protein O)
LPSQRTHALILRSIDVFETSSVVTLFTRELGKVAALAKGARRLKSAFQGGLDLLGVSDIVLIPKASEALDLLTEAAPVERFSHLRRDLAALYAGFYFAELLIELTDYHDPHPKLFDAVRITLRHLDEPEMRNRRIVRLELACLRELGLMPALEYCVHCGQPIDDRAQVVWFGLYSGGVLCDDCRTLQSDVSKLSRGDFEIIRTLARPGSDWRQLDPRHPSLAVAGETVGAVISHSLGHRPRLRPRLGE